MKTHGIILFDGICNFCNGVVQFLIRRDRHDYFRYCPLQSPKGQALLKQFDLKTTSSQSVVLIENGKAWQKSDAFYHMMKRLPGGWKIFYLIIIIPRFIRDGVYEFISRNRYKWFGKRETCMIPTPEQRKKFLSEKSEEKDK